MLNKTKISMVATLLFAFLAVTAITTPAVCEESPISPSEHSSATLNGKTITIDYSAPSIRGRKILGELIPIDKVWRTGDNAATILRTPIDLKVGDLYVPAGSYSVYSIVTKNGYQLIINKQTGQSGTEYDQSQDLGRTRLNTNDTDGPIEQLILDFENTHDKKTELHIKWGYSESWLHITAQ